MADDTIDTETTKDDGIILLSNSMLKIKSVVKELEGGMKNLTRQEQYHARQAVNSLKMLLASAVTG